MTTKTLEKINNVLLLVCFAGVLLVMYLALEWAPLESTEGHVQRIFYVHVPVSWSAFLAFFVVFISGAVYLIKRDERWDWLAVSAAELGLLMTTLSLISGIIWGRPTWGVWWVWDPRLTSTLLMWMIYVSYLMVRAYSSEVGRGSRLAAVIGILGFADVPIVYYSVVWWQNIHPQPLIRPGSLELTGSMASVLLISMAVFTVMLFYMISRRFLLEKSTSELAMMKRTLQEEEQDSRIARIKIDTVEK